jgi:hypothetical protein
VFGRNNHGQLGTGDDIERHAPCAVPQFNNRRVLSVAAGFYHTVRSLFGFWFLVFGFWFLVFGFWFFLPYTIYRPVD